MPVTIDHVTALNLVEVEYYNCPNVIGVFRELITHYMTNYGDEKTIDELKAANDKADRIKTRMLSAMARVLRYKFGEIDLFEGGYVPRAWSDELGEQQAIRRGVLRILDGTIPLQIAPFVPRGQVTPADGSHVFPPKPT